MTPPSVILGTEHYWSTWWLTGFPLGIGLLATVAQLLEVRRTTFDLALLTYIAGYIALAWRLA